MAETSHPVDPAKCKVDGPGFNDAQFRKETRVTVTTMLPNGAPTEEPVKVTAEFKSLVNESVVQLKGQQKQGNTYEVEIYPNIRGRHQLAVSVNDQPIAGSPFPMFVGMPPRRLGKPEKIIGGLFYPFKVKINSAEEVVITEYRTIGVFDKEGKRLPERDIKSDNDDSHITGLAIDEDGTMYVVDRVCQRVLKYSEAGEILKTIGGKRGDGPCEFNEPDAVAIIEDNIVICDKKNHRLQVLTKDTLEFVKTIGSQGEGDEQFNEPVDIAQDKVGNMYVCDSGNNRVKLLNKQGEFQLSFSKKGNDQLNDPRGVCVAGQYVYITEHGASCVSMFTRDGQFVTSFGKGGASRGEFVWPYGICVDGDGFIYVCDHGKNRVQVF